jgi:tRNA threonylcarbamoyladenosine biosynthesis protein TsaE
MSAGPDDPRRVITSSAQETEALGARLAGILRDGDVVLLRGELGSGKTTLVRGAARALGFAGLVTSPTFSIGHRYPGAAVTISHLDLYRLAAFDPEDPALLDDYLGPGRIAFLEWPDVALTGIDALAGAPVEVRLAHAGGDRREIEWSNPR